MVVILLRAEQGTIGHPPFKACGLAQSMQDIMRDDRRAIEVERFVEEVVITDFGRNGGVFAVGMVGVALAELVLNELAIQGAHATYGKVLAGNEGVVRGQQCKGLELELAPELLGAPCLMVDHGFDEWTAHSIGKQSLAKDGCFKGLPHRLKGMNMGALLGRFEIEGVADQTEILQGIEASSTRLIEEDRSDLSGNNLRIVGYPVELVQRDSLVGGCLLPERRPVE